MKMSSSAMSFSSLEKFSSSLIDSLLYLKPIFGLKPIDQKSNSNISISYTHIFGFESLFESHELVDNLGVWMQNNWKLSILVALVYIILIFIGKLYMNNRPRYELRIPLILWNIFLATFSIIGTIRTWPEFLYSLTQKGVVHSVCDASYAYSISGFWAFMFIMSKLPELVDTLFIVLRKQELIFLHWYHHATVLIYCWYSYKDFSATGRWFMTMNYLVHSIMYSYYACKAMKIRVPLFISKLITTSQLVQMVFGCYVNWVAYQTKKHNSHKIHCNITNENIFYSFMMYLSYFVLFFHFFLNAYILKKKQLKEQQNIQKRQNGTYLNGHVKKVD